jgi:hypothetical protein
LGQSLSPESENVDYDVTTFTGSHAETLKKVLLRFYSKYLYIGPQIKHGDQVQQFEYNKRHILKDLDIFINMQLMKLDDDIQNENMKKVIKLTEADLTRIVRRVIKENDDYKDRSMYDPYYGDDDSYEEDEDLGSTDKGEEKLQDLIEEARDILENECGYDFEDINEMSEREIVECLFDEGYDEIASEMEELLDQEGFEK